MIIYLIVFLAIFIPYFAPKTYKRKALLISMLILFIPFGLQYDMTCDWNVHLQHWRYANGLDVQYGRELEPIYYFLCKSSKPITFFGWLMLSAVAELTILYYLIRKTLPSAFYWVSIAVLMLYRDNALLMIDSNRQTWALMSTMVGTTLFGNKFYSYKFTLIVKKDGWYKLIIPLLFFVIAFFIHKGAITALGLIPLLYLSKRTMRLDTPVIVILTNILFCFRFWTEGAFLQQQSSILYDIIGLEGFDTYLNEIKAEDEKSIALNCIYWIIMNLILITYHKLTPYFKFTALAMLVACLFNGFLTGNIQRILQYYYIYSFILLPYVFYVINNRENKTYIYYFRRIIAFILLLLVSYDFHKVITSSFVYNKWLHFETIFSAPHWL